MLETLLASSQLLAIHHALRDQKNILMEDLWNAPKALLVALAQKATGKHVLILTGSSQEEVSLFHDFPLFTDRHVVDFPAWETLPAEGIPPSPDIVGERYRVLEDVISKEQPHIIISSLQGCLQRIISPDQFCHLHLSLKVGETIPIEKVTQKLKEMGYQKSATASDKGEFAVRGGLIDIFPVSSPDPYRLDFWGNELESIRIYDPVGQKSIRMVDSITITAAQELEFLEKAEKLSTLLDYLGNNTLVVFDDLLALEDRYASLVSASQPASKAFSSIEDFLEQLRSFQKIFWTQSNIEQLSEVKSIDRSQNLIEFDMFGRKYTAHRFFSPFQRIVDYLSPEDSELSGEELLASLSALDDPQMHVHFFCASDLEVNTLQKKISEAHIHLNHKHSFHIGYLSRGFVLGDAHLLAFPFTEITHRYKIRRQKLRSTYHTPPSETFNIRPGDTVVHLNSGIGKYLGLEKRPNNQGIPTEFFILEYAESAKLYVPLNQAHLLTKYIGAGEGSPQLHTLGSNKWKKTKDKTQQAILGYAADLLDLYAKRALHGGFAFPEDSPDMKAFEEDFAFEETEDQLNAIAKVKEDLRSGKSMDRLICGDVGYGKTEVAMRAAFKCAVDGRKQVAVLVPTTVLAMQHFENFSDRMSNFPIRVGVLSRFQTAKQVRETLEGVAKGYIDIVIGTHRIISDDVVFKDLGLIIIDEEQRFGVRAKEHLKKIKTGVDCLTLSATPIPRTLYMSLAGARDLSLINTPPQDRLPIKTVITEPNEQVLKNALTRELTRDGQAYVIHNRVETIYDFASHIKKLLPQARVVVGHGQMHADDIDAVFHAFKSGEADILVATTIVENGIDIPNANTILIDRADHFGLADLYQLRGRVGRWNRRAYAYFLVKNLHRLPDLSRQRLNALAETSGYGGGMKVAMRDLEIRGAGDILGTEQSGHVAAVGFHLYCKMLQRTVKTLEGKAPVSLYDTKIECSIDARLPEDYVNEISLRMEIYQRIGEASSWEEIDAIWLELEDRFGTPPLPAQWLYHLSRLRVFASLNQFSLIKIEKLSLTSEQQKGDSTVTRKVLLQNYKTPEEWEARILEKLK